MRLKIFFIVTVLCLYSVLQTLQAQPNPCNCDPFDTACLSSCSGGSGGEIPQPCLCDPFDNDCLELHPECNDENSFQ